MKKKEAIAALKEKLGCTTEEAQTQLTTVLDLISEALVSEDKEFNIIGWGKFTAVDKPARQGRNPSTGAVVEIDATTAVKFKVGSKLKAAVKAGEALTL